jgi:hypothetical protein
MQQKYGGRAVFAKFLQKFIFMRLLRTTTRIFTDIRQT